MGQFTKLIAWVGFVAAIGLCIFDFITSVMGIWIVLGRNDDNVIAVFMPVIFALLALCFNGLSAYMFRMFLKGDFGKFAPTVTCIMWIFFVIYDGSSAFVGMLDTYSKERANSLHGIMQGMEQLGGAGAFLVLVMALLLSFGPFLCCMFYELARPATVQR
jgi:hypothetical protein